MALQALMLLWHAIFALGGVLLPLERACAAVARDDVADVRRWAQYLVLLCLYWSVRPIVDDAVRELLPLAFYVQTAALLTMVRSPAAVEVAFHTLAGPLLLRRVHVERLVRACAGLTPRQQRLAVRVATAVAALSERSARASRECATGTMHVLSTALAGEARVMMRR